MLLRNGRISGVNDNEPVDLLIADGVISAIGHGAAGGSRSVDLAGQWVSPGLWDNHVHVNQWALTSRRLDVSHAASAREVAILVAAAIAGGTAMEPGRPFIGSGFRDGLWPDAPNLALLDTATGAVPVVLVSGDLHSVWLNSAALAMYGRTGHPTGLFVEDEAFELTGIINTVADRVLDAWVHDAAAQAASRGVVGVVDLEMQWNLDPWQRRMAAGTNSLRVEFGVYTEHLDRAIALGLKSGHHISDLLTMGRLKILTDGSLNTRTAYCYDEYPGLEGQPNSRGLLTVPPAQLEPVLRRSIAAGIEPTVHAIGDHAVTLVLDMFEKLDTGGRMEHAQLVDPKDFPRFAELGVTASVQPDHAMDDRDVADRYWHGRTSRAFAFRSLLDAGAELALGSDAPVSPLDPWRSMAAAVGRDSGGREPWHPEQRITAAEALAASVRTTVDVGQPADLIVTESNPVDSSADELRSMTVAATILGGRFTHGAL